MTGWAITTVVCWPVQNVIFQLYINIVGGSPASHGTQFGMADWAITIVVCWPVQNVIFQLYSDEVHPPIRKVDLHA